MKQSVPWRHPMRSQQLLDEAPPLWCNGEMLERCKALGSLVLFSMLGCPSNGAGDASNAETSTATTTDSPDCVPRELGCECSEGLCLGGLVCVEGICVGDCLPGELGCECSEGLCLGDLVCADNVCTEPDSDDDGDGTDDDGESTTGGDESTTTTTTTGDDGDPVPCGVPMVNVPISIPQVMFVLDKSGSMLTTWDHDDNPGTAEITRWNSLHNVVSSVLFEYTDQMDFGAMLFPSAAALGVYSAAACVISPLPEVPVSDDIQDVLGTIPPANTSSIAGGTPGQIAVQIAGGHLATLDPSRPKALVYVSDGAANCTTGAAPVSALFEVYDDGLPATVASLWNNEGIPTYALGIDISTQLTPSTPDGSPDDVIPWCKMDEIGEEGGRPNDQPPGMACQEAETVHQDFYLATNELELQDAASSIIEDLISCVVTFDPEPEFPDLLEVEIAGEAVPRVNDCDSGNGWVYTTPAGPYDSITLCGTACNDLQQATSADVLYWCES